MATVMATIANNGTYHTPYVIQKIVGPDGKVVFDENSAGTQALTPDVAACEQNILRGVVTGGTGGNAAVDGHSIFGKTGTTDGRADAWFIGATPAAGHRGLVRQPHRSQEPGARVRWRLPRRRCSASFMTQALAGLPDIPLPDPGPVCARAGFRREPRRWSRPECTGVRPAPLPTVQQQPTTPAPAAPAAPTTPAATAPGTAAQ